MPRIKTKRVRYPHDWDKISDSMEEFEEKMRLAEEESHEGKKQAESLWPIFRVHHEQSRFIYDMFYRKKTISRECYEFCLREKYADAALIAKWKKAGYERLCCLRCIQSKETNHGTTCICRVPRKDRESEILIQCASCGCRGCASSD